MPKSTLSNPRGVRGAASLCAVAALAYLFVQDLLTIFVSALMGMRVQGANLSDPVGFSVAAQGLLGIVVAAGSIVLPLWWLLRATRLQTQDLRILLPAPWSPAFCLVVFLGLANAGNLFGGLLARGLGVTTSSTALPAGGLDLFIRYFSLCVVPAVLEEIYFRGALQGIMRPAKINFLQHKALPRWCAASFWAGWLSAAAVFCPACCCISSTIPWRFSAYICANMRRSSLPWCMS